MLRATGHTNPGQTGVTSQQDSSPQRRGPSFLTTVPFAQVMEHASSLLGSLFLLDNLPNSHSWPPTNSYLRTAALPNWTIWYTLEPTAWFYPTSQPANTLQASPGCPRWGTKPLDRPPGGPTL